MTDVELQLLLTGPATDVINAFTSFKKTDLIANAIKQYNPATHNVVVNKVTRPDRNVDRVVDREGGGTSIEKTIVFVARIPIPLEKNIVSKRATFLCGNPIKLDASAENDAEVNMLAVIKKTWDDNKLDYKSKTLAKLMMSETECAELWYTEDASPDHWNNTPIPKSKFKLRSRILANSLGDTLHPLFDSFGDMVAFGRGYKLKVYDKEVEHFDIYTADKRFMFTKSVSDWTMEEEPNLSGKIPVIYFSQPAAEWADVQVIIERIETLLSNFADTNDYFGHPMLAVAGKITSLPKKTDAGKVVELATGATMTYLTWDHAPEAVKMELEYLFKLYYSLTNTPDVSFDNIKGLGQVSGTAWGFLFSDAHMAAADKEEIFGEAIQRRINFLKIACTVISKTLLGGTALSIKPKFEYYLPKDNVETINTLITATQGGIMSKETAVKQNPLIEYPEDEIILLGSSALDNIMNQPVPGTPVN